MPQATQKRRALGTASRRDYVLLTAVCAAISIAALIFYYHQGAILLYGDAVAHINIARRVFDSRTPTLLGLGTVWLPLPHLLDIPFIVNDRMWQTGLGASIPSMLSYIVGALGIFRLVRGLASRSTAWLAALIYALNPNLIYMQATAMTETLYLALFVWAVVYFSEFVRLAAEEPRRAGRSLMKCGVMVALAMLVRYDGWFLAAVIALCALMVIWRENTSGAKARNSIGSYRRPKGLLHPVDAAVLAGTEKPEGLLRRKSLKSLGFGWIVFILLAGATAGAFLFYNYEISGNALEFANGPYSARAIQERSRTPSFPTYPGENSPRDAALQFLKVSRLNTGEGPAEYLLFTAAFLALLAAFYFARRYLPWAVLWTPIIFYMLCVAWGSVPIYHPRWWPFSYYNVRYGLQLLPAIVVFAALACQFMMNFFPRRKVLAAAGLAIAISCFSAWYATPICLREAHANGDGRDAFERALATELAKLPPSATLMMDCGAHSGAMQFAGIPFRRVLRESNPPYWEQALKQPAQSADYIIAFPGDAVDHAVRQFPAGLMRVATVGTPLSGGAVIYRAMR
jgi:dolichyl-phosphate-mannose-protein mannosyltransferase